MEPLSRTTNEFIRLNNIERWPLFGAENDVVDDDDEAYGNNDENFDNKRFCEVFKYLSYDLSIYVCVFWIL